MFGLDIFNKKKVAELELQLKRANDKVETLTGDVHVLERLNYELKARLGQLPKTAARVKSAEQSWLSTQGSTEISKDRPQASTMSHSSHHTSTSNYQANHGSGLATALIVGAVIASASDEEQAECTTEVSSEPSDFNSCDGTEGGSE